MKHPLRWLLASLALMLATPFAVFPEIMGDLGPRSVEPWRNWLALALLSIAITGALFSATVLLRRVFRRMERQTA